MHFFYARVLSGAILVNRMTGEALLINTIEVYERFRATDNAALYTIWTYCNFEGQNDEYSDGIIASKLFYDIVIQVIKYQKTATIEEGTVYKLIQNVKAGVTSLIKINMNMSNTYKVLQ
ncbi:hypothetical protein BD770DRAFT_380627 [Pilaira anomala]|nr:hypothetical protein BD770DRAFT_380627 [Pilaira anomala]